MGANPDTALQVNFSTPGRSLVNVYAQDEVELHQLMVALHALVPEIVEIEQLFAAVNAASSVVGAQPLRHEERVQQAPPPQGLPAGVEPMYCSHGEMAYKTGISAKGNNYAIFECPQKDCDSKWPPRKR